MKILNILGALLALAALGVITLIAVIEIQSAISERRVTATVESIMTGSDADDLSRRLGRPAQVLTNSEQIAYWTSQGETTPENCDLQMYATESIPYRWILVYIDRTTRRVVRAKWTSM